LIVIVKNVYLNKYFYINQIHTSFIFIFLDRSFFHNISYIYYDEKGKLVEYCDEKSQLFKEANKYLHVLYLYY
jgi:hypothetical protein